MEQLFSEVDIAVILLLKVAGLVLLIKAFSTKCLASVSHASVGRIELALV